MGRVVEGEEERLRGRRGVSGREWDGKGGSVGKKDPREKEG